MELRLQGRNRRLRQRPRLIRRCRGILPEPEPFQTTDEFAFDGHFTFVIHLGLEGLLLLQPPQQNRCAPVDKSLGQCRVQRV